MADLLDMQCTLWDLRRFLLALSPIPALISLVHVLRDPEPSVTEVRKYVNTGLLNGWGVSVVIPGAVDF